MKNLARSKVVIKAFSGLMSVRECWVSQGRLNLGAGGQCVKADRNDLEIRSAVVRDSSGVKTLLSISTVPALGSCE